MSTTTFGSASPSRPATFLVPLAVWGFIGGAVVSLLAFLAARYGPVGAGWSFRGNGALAAYTAIPPLFAAGWSAVVLHRRSRPWFGYALAAAGVGIAVAAADALLLPVFGARADQTFGAGLLVLLLVWTVVAPVLAVWRGRPARVAPSSNAGVTVAEAGVWAVSVVGGLVLVGMAIPAGS
jgi:hypothetical protein